MKEKGFFFLFVGLVFLFSPLQSVAGTYEFSMTSPIGQVLAPLPENQWVKLNINTFKEVWTPANQRPTPSDAPSYGDPSKIISAWGSMAWDSNRGDLIFYGGGHANYPGNDVYRWRANTLSWERASLPSEVVQVGPVSAHYEAVDGVMNAPIAAHTYDNSEFFPVVDRFVTFGGAVFNIGAHYRFSDWTETGPYFWDPSKANGNQVGGTTGSHVNPHLFPEVVGGRMWQNRNNIQFGEFVNGASGYARENGRDVLYIQSKTDLVKYTVVDVNDPSRDNYEKVGHTTTVLSGQGAGAYDPDRNIFLRTAGRRFTYWNLDSPGPTNGNVVFSPQVLSGSFDLDSLIGYGLDYDPVRKVYVLWNGDPEVWILEPPENLSMGGWTLYPEAIGSPVAPDKGSSKLTGILGKWKYIRSLDVFLGVFDSQNGDIWAYKPKNWQPVPADDHPPFLLNPKNGDYYLEGSDITLEADVIDADGSVLRIEFYTGDFKIGEAYHAPYRATWSKVPAGIHEITAVSVDQGQLLVSQPVTVTVSKTDPSIKTVLLQDGLDGYSGTRDSYIYQYFSNANYGSSDTLMAGSSGSQSSAAVRFAIFESEGGPVPDGVVIDSATLGLYKYTAYDHVYRAYAFLRDWQESEITWNRSSVGVPWTLAGANGSGSDIASVADGEGAVGWSAEWLYIDVSPSVAQFSTGVAPNYGWKIAAVSGNSNTKRFYSREFSDPTLRPTLQVNYREVVTGNLSPQVSISSPTSGQILPMGEAITLRANASDIDGHIVRVEFYQGDVKLGEVTEAPYTLSWTPPQPGAYTLTAVATDNENARTTSSAVHISVVGENIAPTVLLSSPIEGEVFTQGETIVVSAEAFDADGQIAKVVFYEGESKL
ncbi:Ig-like domain-containing protein, partial [Geoalkalibacter halelectricus]|uniref:Ig-like domain-containing protein n=1 Tax=Geoalkalibacter halelectricus TaxID=2847045 RepID=UPI003D1B5163